MEAAALFSDFGSNGCCRSVQQLLGSVGASHEDIACAFSSTAPDTLLAARCAGEGAKRKREASDITSATLALHRTNPAKDAFSPDVKRHLWLSHVNMLESEVFSWCDDAQAHPLKYALLRSTSSHGNRTAPWCDSFATLSLTEPQLYWHAWGLLCQSFLATGQAASLRVAQHLHNALHLALPTTRTAVPIAMCYPPHTRGVVHACLAACVASSLHHVNQALFSACAASCSEEFPIHQLWFVSMLQHRWHSLASLHAFEDSVHREEAWRFLAWHRAPFAGSSELDQWVQDGIGLVNNLRLYSSCDAGDGGLVRRLFGELREHCDNVILFAQILCGILKCSARGESHCAVQHTLEALVNIELAAPHAQRCLVMEQLVEFLDFSISQEEPIQRHAAQMVLNAVQTCILDAGVWHVDDAAALVELQRTFSTRFLESVH